MKFECPNCKKVMMIKDEYAGKTGKCPGCGFKVTLPEHEEKRDMSDIGPESEKIMEAESAEFIKESETKPEKTDEIPDGAAQTPSSKKLIGIVITAVVLVGAGILYYALSTPKIELPSISLYNVGADRYVKRSSGLPTDAILSWQTAIKKVTGEYLTSKLLFFKMPNLNRLWQDDLFSESTSKEFITRVSTVPLHALRDWRTALRRATDNDVGAELSDALFRLVEIDRLFTGTEFNTAVSDTFIDRLNSLSVENVSRWSEILDAEKGQAAIILVSIDPFFRNGEFNQKLFEKKLKSF